MHSSTGKICGLCPSMPKSATPCGFLNHPSPYLSSPPVSIHNTVLENVPHTKYLAVEGQPMCVGQEVCGTGFVCGTGLVCGTAGVWDRLCVWDRNTYDFQGGFE